MKTNSPCGTAILPIVMRLGITQRKLGVLQSASMMVCFSTLLILHWTGGGQPLLGDVMLISAVIMSVSLIAKIFLSRWGFE